MADTGFKSPGAITAASPWNYVNYMYLEDNNGSYCDIDGGSESPVITATDFGFSIPNGSTVDGVEVRILAKSEDPNNGTPYVSHARLNSWDDLADGWHSVSNEYRSRTYGGPTELWGASIAASDVNSSWFGFNLAFENSHKFYRFARVDVIQMKVYYTEPPGILPVQTIWF